MDSAAATASRYSARPSARLRVTRRGLRPGFVLLGAAFGPPALCCCWVGGWGGCSTDPVPAPRCYFLLERRNMMRSSCFVLGVVTMGVLGCRERDALTQVRTTDDVSPAIVSDVGPMGASDQGSIRDRKSTRLNSSHVR